jgi:hypothetical protein
MRLCLHLEKWLNIYWTEAVYNIRCTKSTKHSLYKHRFYHKHTFYYVHTLYYNTYFIAKTSFVTLHFVQYIEESESDTTRARLIFRILKCLICLTTLSLLNDSLNYRGVNCLMNGKFLQKIPTRCKSVSKFYYSIFKWSSTCFGWHTVHHQGPKTAQAASGFA